MAADNLSLAKSGTFKLRIYSDLHTRTEFERKYNIKLSSKDVPFICVPKGEKLNGYSDLALIGCIALVYDNTSKKYSFAVVAHIVDYKDKDWNVISSKCADNLGIQDSERSSSYGPKSNYTVYVDTSQYPEWKGTQNDVLNLIKSAGKSSFGGEYMEEVTDTAYGSAISGNYISRDSINWDYLNYLIITLDRNSPTVDLKALKDHNVSGAIVEAGYLYNASHQEVYYRNPKLDKQCVACSLADLPFGLYCDSKARSVDEAKKEIYQLSFCIRKYPPVLGMWVHFQCVKSKSINDSIIDYYQSELVRLGLKDRIGILATESELSKMSWADKHYENWSLWLNKHLDTLTDIEQLLTPELFRVD